MIPITVHSKLTLYHTGPSLDLGPLPSFFYFSLSGKDSLTLDPYNQPVQFLQNQNIRVFSLTLPAHEEGLSPNDAMSAWAKRFTETPKFLDPFFQSAEEAISFAIQENLIDPNHMAIGGLSRGAFIASHIAARDKRFKLLLGFAPLTQLGAIKEFHHLNPSPYDLKSLAPLLEDRRIRFYIGNADTRVSTRSCFEFVMSLTEGKKRSPEVELLILKSIGQMGHGTSPETFKQGAEWIVKHI